MAHGHRQKRHRRVIDWGHARKFRLLLAALVALLVIQPLVEKQSHRNSCRFFNLPVVPAQRLRDVHPPIARQTAARFQGSAADKGITHVTYVKAASAKVGRQAGHDVAVEVEPDEERFKVRRIGHRPARPWRLAP